MLKDQWKYNAWKKLAIICAQLKVIEKDARSHIKEDLAIDVRDFTQDMINCFELFDQKHAEKLMPRNQGD